MYQEFDFIETLKPYNTFGKKVVDCGECRSYTLSYQQVERTKYEISITDCIPEDLKVEVDPRDYLYDIKKLEHNKFLITAKVRLHSTYKFFLKSTKFYKQSDAVFPSRAPSSPCISLDIKVLKKLKAGEISVTHYQPFEGVIIDCIIQKTFDKSPSCASNADPEIGYQIMLSCKTHDLEHCRRGDTRHFENDKLRFELMQGPIPSSVARNTEVSTVILRKTRSYSYFCPNGAAETLKIYEKKKSFQQKIDSFGPTDIILKTVDGMVVKIHKEIFVSKSPIFKALLEAKIENPSEIDVTHDAETVFRAMTYVYDDEIDFEGFEIQCYKFADEFGMPELKEKCLEALEKMDMERCMGTPKYSEFHKFAHEYSIKSLIQKIQNCFDFTNFLKDKDAIKEFAKCSAPVF